jgi:hypothetical protein
MNYLLNLERFKIYIKTHTKYRSYMFRSTTIIRELVLSLAKVIFVLKHSVKLRKITPLYDMLPHPHITYNDVILPSVFI